MSRASRRARSLAWLLALAATLPAASSAYAAFTSSATTSQALSTRTLVAPGALTAAASGHDVVLAWSAGQNGSSYAVAASPNGTSNDCNAASFAAAGTTSTTSFTDARRYAPQGSWVCYRVQTTYGGWTSQSANPVAAAQIGVVAASVQLANGGTAGVLDGGDRITITFNQSVSSSSGPSSGNTVCTTSGAAATLVLASTRTKGSCSDGESTRLGTIAGLTISAAARWNASYAWGGGGTTLVVTLGSQVFGSESPTVSAGGGAVFDPTQSSAALLSARGGYHVCDAESAGSDCLPQVSGAV